MQTSEVKVQRSHRSRKLLAGAAAATISLMVVVAPPAEAINISNIIGLFGGKNPLVQIFKDVFQAALRGDLLDYALDTAKKYLGEYLGQYVNDVWSEHIGDLGIPNPISVGEQVEQAVKDGGGSLGTGRGTGSAADWKKSTPPDVFEASRVVYSTFAKNEMNRQSTLLQVENALGKQGQTQQKQELDQVTNVVKESLSASDKAMDFDVTQDVMKAMTTIVARESVLIAALKGDTMRIHQDIQYTNMNLANASRTLDELSRAQRVQDSSGAMNLLDVSGQADLF